MQARNETDTEAGGGRHLPGLLAEDGGPWQDGAVHPGRNPLFEPPAKRGEQPRCLGEPRRAIGEQQPALLGQLGLQLGPAVPQRALACCLYDQLLEPATHAPDELVAAKRHGFLGPRLQLWEFQGQGELELGLEARIQHGTQLCAGETVWLRERFDKCQQREWALRPRSEFQKLTQPGRLTTLTLMGTGPSDGRELQSLSQWMVAG